MLPLLALLALLLPQPTRSANWAQPYGVQRQNTAKPAAPAWPARHDMATVVVEELFEPKGKKNKKNSEEVVTEYLVVFGGEVQAPLLSDEKSRDRHGPGSAQQATGVPDDKELGTGVFSNDVWRTTTYAWETWEVRGAALSLSRFCLPPSLTRFSSGRRRQDPVQPPQAADSFQNGV